MKLVQGGYYYCTKGSQKNLRQMYGNGKNKTYDQKLKEPLVLLKMRPQRDYY